MSDRILVCDDDAAVCQVLEQLLSRQGFQVQTVESGVFALEEIAQRPPDLLLLDVHMPVMDGVEVCRRVRAMPGCDLLPIMMVTALTDTASRVRGLDAGADEFTTKPIETAVLLARIRSLLRVKHVTDQLERTEGVIFALARTVEARDAYTDRHLWRLAEYSRVMTVAIGGSASEARHAWYGGLLHDIGKIAIDPMLLRKTGPLTPEEFEEVKRHPDVGASIIATMRFAPVVAPIVRGHHERWDGGGYPQGLAGESIPLGARIVAVVDSYDAMVTDRPYRNALDRAETIRRLEAGSGEQWDPALVEIFLELLRTGSLPLPAESGTVVAFPESPLRRAA